MDQSAPARPVRVLAVTVMVVCLAAAGHLAGGGTLPALPVLLGCAGLVLLVGRVCRNELSLPRLLTVLGVTQVILHEAFTVLSAPGGCSGAAAHAHPGPGHPGGRAAECVDVLVQAAAHHSPSAGGFLMVVGHAVAGAATAVALARTETALQHVADWLRPLTTVPVPVVLPAGPRRPPLPPAEAPARVWWGSCRLRVRGPPAGKGA